MDQLLAARVAARCRKTCAVVGVGISNLPLVRFLREHGAAVTARDRKTEAEIGAKTLAALRETGAKLRLGEGYLDDLTEDVIFRTPGLRPDLPAFRAAVARGSELTSEMEWFLECSPAPVLGVTGSDGKTTTATLTYLFLQEEANRRGSGRVFLGGNIGEPLLPRVESMTAGDFAVAELSSFQLQTVRTSPARALITNLTPNHLDWHTDMAEYLAAKTNVFAHTGCKFFVTNADDPTTAELARTAPVPVALFSLYDDPADRRPRVFPKDGWIVFRGGADERRILPTSAIRVPGRHNLQNFMAAIALTWGLASPESVAAVAGRFRGVPHRMEKIGTVDGVTYYNSSIDSSPSRTAATLAAFREMGIRPVVICGGYDKKLPFAPLAGALAANAKAVVLTGATAGAIAGAIRACPAAGDLPVRTEPDFEGAVRAARDLAQSGDAVLLSPACASFDAFRNFAERGDAFRSVVERFGR